MISPRNRIRELKCERAVTSRGHHLDQGEGGKARVLGIIDEELAILGRLEQLRLDSLGGRPGGDSVMYYKRYVRSFTNIYMIICKSSGAIKIGRADDIRQRLSSLQVSTPSELALLSSFRAPAMFEAVMHAIFSRTRLRGEWFGISDDLLDAAEIANDKGYAAVLLKCREIVNRSTHLTV